MVAYRFALYFPEFVTHLITFVVPYIPPSPEYVSPIDLAKSTPSFGYQTQLGSEEGIIEANTQDKDGVHRFLNTVYGGSTSDGKYAFSAMAGVDFALASQLSHTRLLDAEEMEYYVDEYARNGLRGPCEFLLVVVRRLYTVFTSGLTQRYRQLLPHTPPKFPRRAGILYRAEDYTQDRGPNIVYTGH